MNTSNAVMNNSIYRIGFWAGMIAFGSTIAFGLVQWLQLIDVLHFPWDQRLIYGFSLAIVIPFLIEIMALHYTTAPEDKFWSHGVLTFTTLYAAFTTLNYVVQLSTVIPMTLNGTDGAIILLKQTPHSLFWDIDAIGYLFLGVGALFAVPIFKKRGIGRWVKYAFLTHALVTPLIGFVYFYPFFSPRILLIATPWVVTAPAIMFLLAFSLKKDGQIKPFGL